MVPGVPCIDHGNWGREMRHCSLFVTECVVLRRKFWLESRPIHSSHIQRCPSFSERVGPQIILLESQPGKQSSCSTRSREITTELIAVWVQSTKTLAKNRQSMRVCGYCCYYLEHCSKTNHIAIKRAKYGEKKITCEVGGTLCGRIIPSIVRGIVRDYWRTNVLAKS